MEIQKRLLKFVTRANWMLLFAASLIGVLVAPADFARGIVFGGLIVTINFHLLYRTLRKAFVPSQMASHHAVLAKYYVRFAVSGVILFFLVSKHIVNPLGLFVGLSVVVVSIVFATIFELTKLIYKEAA